MTNTSTSGCNLHNGYCTKPSECMCANGWAGENCTECRVQPNCPGTCSVPHGCVCSDPSINGLCTIGDNPPRLSKTILQLQLMQDHCLHFASFYQYSNIEPRVINNANVDRNYSVEPRISGNTMVNINSNPMYKVTENATEATTEAILDILSRYILDVSDEKKEGKCIIM